MTSRTEPAVEAESPSDGAVVVRARVVRAMYANEDSGWAAIRCRNERLGTFTVVGALLGVQPDDDLRLTGRWIEHRRYGRQFEVTGYTQVMPSTLRGIRRFLSSGRIRGIGPKMAARIVDHFGLETLEVIEHEPDRLRGVRGIGRKTIDKITSSWSKHRGIQQIMVFLTGHGVAPNVAVKAHSRYGARALEVVRSYPYRLAEEVFGVGFRTADRIARGLGMALDAPQRLEAAVEFVLSDATGDGHVYLPQDELVDRASELLAVDGDLLPPAIVRLSDRDRVVIRRRRDAPSAVYLRKLEEAEATVARDLRSILDARSDVPAIDLARAIDWYQQRSSITLAGRQREALAAALGERAVVVTGGPGTGKTTLIRGVIQILRRKEQVVLLAAPTGRAAKRLQEATGADARTIHRLLEFQPADRLFQRNRANPLDADVVVIDEVSMLDIELAAHLLDALPQGCRLVLVGDADQLPSVGPGNVLADLITSGVVPVIRLTDIFRQAEHSLIVVNAHRINVGEFPLTPQEPQNSDFFFVARDDPAQAAELGVDFAVRRIPRRFGLDPIEDIQILTPMHRGELGVSALNERLQALLAPDGPEIVVGARRFRAGDKIMQIRNNYELDVFNGDIGRVVAIDPDERELTATFDGRTVLITGNDLDDIVPAYACTIHKSQGSEYPAVVVLLHHQHHLMLQRNLLYTAVTRGKRLVVIVGSRRALGRAVHNATVRQRNTLLAERLRRQR